MVMWTRGGEPWVSREGLGPTSLNFPPYHWCRLARLCTYRLVRKEGSGCCGRLHELSHLWLLTWNAQVDAVRVSLYYAQILGDYAMLHRLQNIPIMLKKCLIMPSKCPVMLKFSTLTPTFGEVSNSEEAIEPLICCLCLCFQSLNHSLAYYHSRTGSNHY